MEQTLLSDFNQLLKPETNPSLKPFSIAKSLIINPSTSNHTLNSIFQTLETLITTNPQFPYLHVIITLLSTISTLHHHHFTHRITSVFQSLSTRPNIPPRATALVSTFSAPEMSEGVLLSLCFGSIVAVRLRMLVDVEKFDVRPVVLMTVLLGFSKDPYPYVRKAALDGLIGLCKWIVVDDCGAIKGCYLRGVELLFDSEECVRCSAVNMVCEWGKLLVANIEDKSKRDWSDALYIQLCLMVRDMSANVRVEAFKALGRVGMASNSVLMQTLSKKVLPDLEEKKYPGQLSANHFNLPASSAARAFLHGLEDEFFEVRSFACYSMRTPAIVSADFAVEALDLLMDVLNDDSIIVRLQVLETMHHMAVFGHLKLKEMHMHMFLGTLVDMNSSIRCTARKVLRSTNLIDLPMFKLVVDSLIQSLEIFPQDEPDVLSLLFEIGRSHAIFAACITKEMLLEIDPSSESTWDFNSSKTAAHLALAISAPLTYGKQQCSYKMPSIIFSYAVTMLGRLSIALNEFMNQDTLLAYLSHCSTSTESDPTDDMMVVEDDLTSETNCQIPVTHVADPLEVQDKEYSYVKLVLANIAQVWPLTKIGCISELLTTLRSWKDDLATCFMGPHESDSVLKFTLQYIHVVKLLAKAWCHVMCPLDIVHNELGDLGYILHKLEKRLKELRFRFIGLSKEEASHIEELTLVTFTLILSTFDPHYHESVMKKLLPFKDTSNETSNFVIELTKILQKNENSIECFRVLLDSFSFKQLVLRGDFKYMKAEMDFEKNDWLNPFPFVAGLPVGIPLKIRLQNTPIETKIWLMMTLSKGVNQYMFIDLKQFEGCDKIREFTIIAPFYRTPKVNSFILRLSIGMECLSEKIHSFRDECEETKWVRCCLRDRGDRDANLDRVRDHRYHPGG
ncbi:protein SIEL isoform X2 [Rutidosis leptorrhynchoides]|uniref:protein SIEL isoform X2 n=1 Tax=Rutidosis leptorrhynchoides TaxID=125765 RepID=UPI003A996327